MGARDRTNPWKSPVTDAAHSQRHTKVAISPSMTMPLSPALFSSVVASMVHPRADSMTSAATKLKAMMERLGSTPERA